MRRLATAVLLTALVVCLFKFALMAHPQTSPSVAIYDANPSHPWNRLNAALRVRQDREGRLYGEDSIDPMLWRETEHLLSEPSHQQAIQALDEFLRGHAETLVHDPLRRAMLQHDLWAVFDWTIEQYSANQRPPYDKEKLELQTRLAEVLRRVALSSNEINALPDNYAQAVASGMFPKEYDPAQPERTFLPPDLFEPRGRWGRPLT